MSEGASKRVTESSERQVCAGVSPVYVILLNLFKHLVDIALSNEPSIDSNVPCITAKNISQ